MTEHDKDWNGPYEAPGEWEKDFDQLFWLYRVPSNTKQMKDIKSFIRDLRAKDRDDVRMIISRLSVPIPRTITPNNIDEVFRQAQRSEVIQQVLQALADIETNTPNP